MTIPELHSAATTAWFAVAAVTFLTLQFVAAPYGKHIRAGWGPTVPNRIGWMVMESPPILVFVACFAAGDRVDDPSARVFLALFVAHYVHRAWIYPLRMRTRGKRIPLVICALAFTTNIAIGWIQAWWLFALGPVRGADWLTDPRFLVGLALFGVGVVLNHDADGRLRRLRAPDDTGYVIPRGGLFRWVSSPHYLGEIIEWTGWVIATWSLPTLAFLAWTLSNLLPRADATHRWYRETFEDYPPRRKRVFPGIW